MVKEYLAGIIDFQKKKALFGLLFKFWGLVNNFFAFVLIFGFWLSLIDFPPLGMISIWIVFLIWQGIYIFPPIKIWYHANNPKENDIENGLWDLNLQYPLLEKLLSAYLLEKKYS